MYWDIFVAESYFRIANWNFEVSLSVTLHEYKIILEMSASFCFAFGFYIPETFLEYARNKAKA